MGSSLATGNRRLQRDSLTPPTVVGGAAVDYTLFPAVLGALGTALVLARGINYGVGFAGDSLHYISTAQMLLAGKGFWVDALDAPYTLWPPRPA